VTTAEADLWDRTWIGWDVAFAVGVAVAGAGAAAELAGGRRVAEIALLVALAGWYALVGWRALRTDTERDSVVYLAVATPLFLAAFALYGTVGLLFFVFYPQVWALFHETRRAVAASVLLTVGGAAVSLFALDGARLVVLVVAGVQLTFAVAMGTWISGIVRQSAGRREIIEELEAARAELAAVSHRAGVLAERERMAREIHDTLAQGFTSMVMLLELAESEVDSHPAAARRRLAVARDTARQNLAESRALVAALTPVDLQSAPLPQAIGRLVDRFGSETGQPASFDVTGAPRALPPNQEIVLLRAAQESLANVRKHAGSCRVAVTLDYSEPIRLVVADDGAGFDPAADSAGYGLAGMRGRVADVGGSLAVHSGRSGTTVEVRCSG
jgi:signal transduction histidine kinase